MSALTPYTVRSLVQDLRRLMQTPVSDRQSLDAWYRVARSVQDRLALPGATLPDLPELIWHYLIDADIRLKDPRYAKEQTDEMLVLLSEMESRELPG